jgi:hypothetical protein
MAATPAWFGWLWWPERGWTRMCDGMTLASCGRKLAALAKRRRVPDKHSCLTGGACPAFTPKEEPAMKQAIRLKFGRRKTPPLRRAPKKPLPKPAGEKPAAPPGPPPAGGK